MNSDVRESLVEKFKKTEKIESCGEADRIFKYFVIFGHEGLFTMGNYLSRLRRMTISGLANDDVDRLLNEILDDENGYYAYKIGLVKESVDGVEIDDRQYGVFSRFISFLKKNQQQKWSQQQ
ncbi:MAG: hypothetical protein JW736_10575 [Deltaproteobacteria bacterium]|nr:hypothetical protein [Deltaproteobacteria bacterium]MBN2687874.1 hypothetical protein [Deltaproteobacteria bacterium]